MHFLLVHQNFPGQFRDLAPRLVALGHRVTALSARQPAPGKVPEAIQVCVYPWSEPDREGTLIDPNLEVNLRRGAKVAAMATLLRQQGLQPDVVIAHSGWGEALYLRDIWPRARLWAYPELYSQPLLLGYGFDPDRGIPTDRAQQSMRRQNFVALAALADSDLALSPTQFQRDTFPAHLRHHIRVLPEGLDLQPLGQLPVKPIVLPGGLVLKPGDPVVTYASRSLEPHRGFPMFMRALPELFRRHARVQVVVVGGFGSSYSEPSPHPKGYRGQLLQELQGQLDLSRLHFLGLLPHRDLLSLLRISSAHVYLTYPYALSWSLMEAMGCAAPLVASSPGPATEVVIDGETGLLVPFGQHGNLSAALLHLLANVPLARRLGEAAQRLALERFDVGRAARELVTLAALTDPAN
jgi:glycosyltransferase involved in cell wall biosynthesis